MALRVAAIDFLNPAPLMWDFDHGPRLSQHYDVHLTEPSNCARELLEGRADLGLIPIAALTPDLVIVPGCTIASLDYVRSIQMIVKGSGGLASIKTIAADTASRSSVAYSQVLFRHFLHTDPVYQTAKADAIPMLQAADAALLIGDPALLAIERREEIESQVGPCQWFDLAYEWKTRTGLPWVAAVWAVRPEALSTKAERQSLIDDLNQSRIHGTEHIEDLVQEWLPRIALPAQTIRHYLTQNIHYALDPSCIEAITLFRKLAAKTEALLPLGKLHFL